MESKTWSKHRAVITRLREGPVLAEEAHELVANANSFRVVLHKLRRAGYVIDREVVYVLRKEPT